MPCIGRLTYPDGSEGICYIVTMAVGKNAANKRDDVLLVQYFLKKVGEKPVSPKTGRMFVKPPGTMTLDGLCGPTTLSWILSFQMQVRNAGLSILVDGRVDPPVSGALESSISRTTYTIYHLDKSFKDRYPEIHANLASHPDVPAEIRGALLPQT